MTSRHWWAACAIGALAVGAGARATSAFEAQRRDVVVVHDRFDDHDRLVARNWYDAHHDHLPIGLRESDRLPRDLELRLDVGFVLDRDWRARIHPVPVDLLRALPAPPRGDRYVIVGGHICLINSRYEVRDVIHLGHER